MLPKRQIKINRRGLTELVLVCAFIALLTYAFWTWKINGGYVAAMDTASPEQHSAILPQILHHPAIILSSVITEFLLLLSITLALVPPSWWLRADHIWGSEPAESTTPLRWLGQKIHSGQSEPEHAEGQYVTNQAGETIYYEHPGMPGVVVDPFNLPPGQQMVAQGNQPQAGQYVTSQPVPGQYTMGQPLPGQMMQPGQPGQMMQPGQPIPGQMLPGMPVQGQLVTGHAQPMPGPAIAVIEGQKPPASQAASQPPVMPPAPLADALSFEVTAEDDPLADLASIGDILSSAFDEDAGVDEAQAALGRGLEEFDIELLRTSARQIMATFLQ